jgi:hypothetical protein
MATRAPAAHVRRARRAHLRLDRQLVDGAARKLNASLARKRHDAVASGSKRVVEGLQVFGLTADLIRGGALTATMLTVVMPIQRYVLGAWSADARVSRAVVVGIAASVAAAAVWKVIHAAPGARWLLAAGIAVGLAAGPSMTTQVELRADAPRDVR